ncbi:MAG: hypothetical protein AAFN92_22610, partial [Bacteroidota bacterium]
IYRVQLNAAGTIDAPSDVVVFAQSFGATPLDVTAQGDDDPFPGTVWAATYGADNITVFEPDDYETPVDVCDGLDLDSVDEDNDGYSNADELDNGTDPCNAASQPTDFDGTLIGGFKVSDLNDPDDDDDGRNDRVDPFPLDADNGLTTAPTFDYPFLNGDPGFGFFGLGFTGLMNNGMTDYLDLIRDEDNSSTEIIAGGAVGLFAINNVPTGTARGNLNDQYDAFQFGMAVDATTPVFDLEVGVLGPVFPGGPQGQQAVGFFLGSGGQDDYLTLSVSAGNGTPELAVVLETAGTPVVATYPVSGLTSAAQLQLFLRVDPAAGTVQPAYALNAGERFDLGTPLSLTGESLTALT